MPRNIREPLVPFTPTLVRPTLCLLLMLHWGLPAAAVDVVLALDRSLSMNTNDPDRDSLKGAELFSEMLNPDDRLALTTFAQDGQSLLPLTPLSDARTLKQLIGLIRQVKMNGTRTDFSAALRLAYRTHSDGLREPPAKRILVLFSDGELNLGSEGATQAARAAIIDELIPQFQAAGIQIHGVAFSPEADLGFLRLLTDATGGQSFRADQPEDIYLAFVKLFEQADHPLTAPVINGVVDVDANVHELKLLVKRGPHDTPIKLTDPSQRELSAGDQRPGVAWHSTPHFDHITIQQPEAGSWKITADNPEKRAYLESDLDLEATVPTQAQVDETVTVAARLTHRGAVDAQLLSSARFTATVLDDSGAVQQRLDLKPDAAGQADPQWRGALRFPALGTFQIRVAAEGQGFQRGKVYSIRILEAGAAAPTQAPRTVDAENRHSAMLILVSGNLVLVVLLAGGASIWWWRRRRRNKPLDFEPDE